MYGGGKTLKDIWIAQGMTPQEAEERDQLRLERIRMAKSRNYLAQKIREAQSLALGDAAKLAPKLDKSIKTLSKELRVNPLKARKNPVAMNKRKLAEQARRERINERNYNPLIYVNEGLTGVERDEKGRARLLDVKAARPEVFDPENLMGGVRAAKRRAEINRAAKAAKEKEVD